MKRLVVAITIGLCIASSARAENFDERVLLAEDGAKAKQGALTPEDINKGIQETKKAQAQKKKKKFNLKAIEQSSGISGHWIGQTKQIYQFDVPPSKTKICAFMGVPASVRSARGTNRGVLITDINDAGYGYQIGLEQGDVVFSINDRVPANAREIDRILLSASDGNIRLLFARPTLDGRLDVYNLRKPYSARIAMLSGAASDLTLRGGIEEKKKDKDKPKIGSGRCEISDEVIPPLENWLFETINSDRRKANLPTLERSAELNNMAKAHARDMAEKGFFGHTSPDGRTVQMRAAQQGVSGGTFRQSIAFFDCIADPKAGLMSTHKSLMAQGGNGLDPALSRVGVGIFLDKNDRLFAVYDFN